MLIDCISDLHGFFPSLPGGDLLLICGDLTARDRLQEYHQFNEWLQTLPYRAIVVIAGNHDGLIEKGIAAIGRDPKKIFYLCDSGIGFEGLKIWGSPYTPTFMRWHFMRNRGQEIKKHWDLIPADTDILITHGPPHEILDETEEGDKAGCEDLRDAVLNKIKPKIHCFGHIHEQGGKITEIGGVKFVNCSYVNERYRPVFSSIRLEQK
jgi:Icc-related predicted phosphoesterase